MAEIFDYDDYRDMIKDYYLEHTPFMQSPPQKRCSDWTVVEPHTSTC